MELQSGTSDDPRWVSNTAAGSSAETVSTTLATPAKRKPLSKKCIAIYVCIFVLVLTACIVIGSGTDFSPWLFNATIAADKPLVECTASSTPTPPFQLVDLTASELTSGCDAKLAAAATIVSNLRMQRPSNKAAILSMVNEIDIRSATSLEYLLSEVHPDAAVRDAATDCYLAASHFSSGLYLDREIYEIVAAVSGQPATDALAQRRYTKLLESFERSGIGLPTAALRARAQNLSDALDELTTRFNHVLSSDSRHLSIDAADGATLAGLDPDFVAAHTHHGLVNITTDYPDLYHVYRHGQSAQLRGRLYALARSRGAPDNLDTLQRVLELRHEFATLLGWPNYAAYVTADKMIRSAEHADTFTREVAALCADASASEIAALRALKAQDAAADGADGASVTLEAFDWSYYKAKLTERDYRLNASAVLEYFRYTGARDGVLAAASQLFGVRFENRTDSTPTWHSAVEVYDVYWAASAALDASADVPIGRVYLDMHPRPSKYKHAAQFTVCDGVDGVQRPEGALVTNFPPHGPMEHSQVVTFMHEFGHLMHHVLGGQDQKWKLFSGVATEWDFVEAPSQMLEAWALDAPTLRRFATHASTGAPIPHELIDAMRTADTFGRATESRQQMFYAQLSLQLHMRDPTAAGFSAAAVVSELAAQFSPYPHVPGTHFEANFGHLMGYSAIYYTYMWSQSIAKQMLSAFNRSGFYDVDTSVRYRDNVLRPGGKQPAASLVYAFLQEAPNLDALHAWLRGHD